MPRHGQHRCGRAEGLFLLGTPNIPSFFLLPLIRFLLFESESSSSGKVLSMLPVPDPWMESFLSLFLFYLFSLLFLSLCSLLQMASPPFPAPDLPRSTSPSDLPIVQFARAAGQSRPVERVPNGGFPCGIPRLPADNRVPEVPTLLPQLLPAAHNTLKKPDSKSLRQYGCFPGNVKIQMPLPPPTTMRPCSPAPESPAYL